MDWTRIKHFTPDERGIACPCCGLENMDEGFMRKLDLARGAAGIPFRITSGCRCEEHNRAVGGKPGSSHLYGLAVDILATSSTARLVILKCAILAGFQRIGIGKDFVHLDDDKSKAAQVAWLY